MTTTASDYGAPLASGLQGGNIPTEYGAPLKGGLQQYQSTAAPGIGSFSNLQSINPYEDPTYGAYMRGLGVNDANLTAETALRQNGLNQSLQQAQPQFAEQLSNGMRSIGGNYEDRGAYNSGQRGYDQTQFGNDVASQQLNFQNGVQGQKDDLQLQLAQGLAQGQQGAAEQALSAQQQIAMMNANAGLYQ